MFKRLRLQMGLQLEVVIEEFYRKTDEAPFFTFLK